MKHIDFKNKTMTAYGFANSEDVDGISIHHAESKNIVKIQTLSNQAGKMWSANVIQAIPADPVILDEVVNELKRISDSLKIKHRR